MNHPFFNYQTLNLNNDYEGKVIATLIACERNAGNRKSVLYLHGFIDYFFHDHVAEAFLENGYDFYALDFRKYGRSLLPHQHPNYCRDVKEYFEELNMTLKLIYRKSNSPIIMLGHSTGGLIAALYMKIGTEKQLVDKLILNSPFLEFNTRPKIFQIIGKLIAGPLSTIYPYANLKNAITPIYPKSIHKEYEGEWEFNLTWKPIKGFPAYFSWIHAIDMAQKLVKSSRLEIPILIIHSSKSFIPKKFNQEVHTSDIVLDIKNMISIGYKIGNQVIIKEIGDAKHDIFLSREDAINNAFEVIFKWLKNT